VLAVVPAPLAIAVLTAHLPHLPLPPPSSSSFSPVPSDHYNILITGEPADDYRSTLGKGFLGLKKMVESDKHRDKKWFVIMGDDVYLHIPNLVNSLSAFDPEENW